MRRKFPRVPSIDDVVAAQRVLKAYGLATRRGPKVKRKNRCNGRCKVNAAHMTAASKKCKGQPRAAFRACVREEMQNLRTRPTQPPALAGRRRSR